MSLDDFESELYETLAKVINNFRYRDNYETLKRMVDKQQIQRFIEDLKSLCNKRNKSFTEPIYRVKIKDFEKILEKYE